MSTEQGPDEYSSGGNDNVSMGDRPAGERIDNREFRRNRHRECYCRGRNKNCPKCQGTGHLLPNWRENLQAARQPRPPSNGTSQSMPPSTMGAAPSPVMSSGGAVSSPAPASRDYRDDRPDRSGGDRGPDRNMDRGPDRGYDRQDRGDRDRGGGGGGGGGGYGRDQRRDRWQSRRDGGGGGGGGRKNQSNRPTGKVCPMCGEFVPNLRAHVLARHDD